MAIFGRRLAYAALAMTALPAVAVAQQGYPPQNNPYPQAQGQQPYPQGQNPYPQAPQGQPYPQQGAPYPQGGQPYPQGGPPPYPQQGQNNAPPYPPDGPPPAYPPGAPPPGAPPYPQQGQSAPPYPQGAPAAAPAPTSVCGRLEGQLTAIDHGNDPARAERTRRIEDTLNRQQGDLERVQAQWQRLGCQPVTLFSMFSNQSPQCGPLGNRISQIRATIDQTTNDLERSRHNADDDMQRQSVLAALSQNNCGPQYRNAAQQRPKGILETLFGGGDNPDGPLLPGLFDPQTAPSGGGFRTLCVRTCDGYYFPVSYSTSQARFPDDEQTCQKMCPATEAVLYTHRNPGEDVAQAVSSSGRVYKDLPNAFRYRRELVAACSCKQAGQTWAEALGATRDDNLEPGDVVVTEERAKAMAQPRGGDNRGRKPAPAAAADAPPDAAASPQNGAPQTGAPPAGKRPARNVGPTLVPQQ